MDVGESVGREAWWGGVETVRVCREDCWGPAVGTTGICIGESGRGTTWADCGEAVFGTRSE